MQHIGGIDRPDETPHQYIIFLEVIMQTTPEAILRLQSTHGLIKSKGWEYERYDHDLGFVFVSIEKQPYERGPQLKNSDIKPKHRIEVVAESLHQAAELLSDIS